VPTPRLPLIALITALVVAGCSSIDTRETAPPLASLEHPQIDAAESALTVNDPASAVALLRLAADDFAGPNATGLRLEAAAIALEMGDTSGARRLLEANDSFATADNQAVATLLRTRLDRDPDERAVIRRLEALPAPLSARLETDRLQTLISAKAATGDWIGAITVWRALDRRALASARRQRNEARLWQALRTAPRAALERAMERSAEAVVEQWLALALGVRERALDPEATRTFLRDYPRPDHAGDVGRSTLRRILAMQRADLSPPRRVAVLLPLSGDWAGAGQSIRDGLLAAYHADGGDRPALAFFDVGDAGMSVAEAYRQARREGAGRIIGPLRKSALRDLVASTDPSVPVLALNRIDSGHGGPRLQQFGLAPENDAMASAALAARMGQERMLMIRRDDDWGARVATAFETAADQAGTRTVGTQAYPADQQDLAQPIKALLRIDASETRHERVESITGARLGFEARRRQDIDGVFMAARERDARLVLPQLRFHRGIGLPVFGLGASVPNQPDSSARNDLEGMLFARMPWLVDASRVPGADALRAQLSATGPSAPATRLHALGIDSYRLLAGISALARDPALSMPAASGRLSINDRHQIQQALVPVQMTNRGVHRRVSGDDAADAGLVP
jgi:outer membrane PBP1 activator LpoA protein